MVEIEAGNLFYTINRPYFNLRLRFCHTIFDHKSTVISMSISIQKRKWWIFVRNGEWEILRVTRVTAIFLDFQFPSALLPGMTSELVSSQLQHMWNFMHYKKTFSAWKLRERFRSLGFQLGLSAPRCCILRDVSGSVFSGSSNWKSAWFHFGERVR